MVKLFRTLAIYLQPFDGHLNTASIVSACRKEKMGLFENSFKKHYSSTMDKSAKTSPGPALIIGMATYPTTKNERGHNRKRFVHNISGDTAADKIYYCMQGDDHNEIGVIP